MTVRQIVKGLHQVPLGFVNVFLVEGDGLTLVDTGTPGQAQVILDSARGLGYPPQDIRHIVLTHLHADHTGSLAELKRLTGATAYMHPADAELTRQGEALRVYRASPGRWNGLIIGMFNKLRMTPQQVAPAEIEVELQDGERLDFAAGMQVVHTPGHTAGHVALLLPAGGGALIAGDAAGNLMGLNYPFILEDLEATRNSLEKIGGMEFDAACFGHGGPIYRGAAEAFRRKWPPRPAVSRSTHTER